MHNDFLTHETEMLNLLKQVVNIESGSYDKEGVDNHAAFWCERYQSMGFEVEVIPNEKLGNNYRIYYPSTTPEILILLHLDTVFPKGTVAERPFSIEGDRAYGPGVIDMKGSHVMVHQVIKQLYATQDERYKKIEVLLNCDEEIGSISSRTVIEQCAKGKRYALVMEPARANGAIVSARRGVGTYVLTIQGKASHSGIAPEAGISAIQELTYKIQSLHALSQHDKGLSVNVGLISGGTSVNTVAPNARAEIDVRISSEQQGVEIDKKVREVCSQPVLEGIQLSLTGGINRPPMAKTVESAELIDIIKQEANKLAITLEDVSTGGGSDASFTAGVGTPTVDGLGPIGGYQHSDKEYLEIPSLTERAQLFFNVLTRITQ
ncbi:M20 family metallopeptidase [Providencia alcalifaciens]|uniref:M20 family metallopeptidase n=2 Tax=Enterobacterales TaxID=91347 RepID=UPI00044F648C|nr:M20 family metallopeptidase [Providencia alcalifaciens]ETT05488.1 peptidase dimerization domain protein [Providencia alcalifaciens F90-2004]EUC94621.1 peptidase dimerization domain protein [Providencia alcalifaciens PAL-2]MTB33470.1 M20/M25/M40 family metallo-hydrolase [Providencia alcalifaciens]MTD00381.1 M20/M25/M40 family metallo-hydrolase [Providencia alcalifaciens]